MCLDRLADFEVLDLGMMAKEMMILMEEAWPTN